MRSRSWIAFAALLGAALFVACLLARPAFADEPIAGTWKLVSWIMEDLETKEQKPIFGQHPGGLLILTPEKRFNVLLTAEGRQGGQTEADRAKSYQTLFALAGKYRIEGNKYIQTVELSYDPALVGRELMREFKIVGNRLTIETAPGPSPLMNNHMARAILVYERESK